MAKDDQFEQIIEQIRQAGIDADGKFVDDAFRRPIELLQNGKEDIGALKLEPGLPLTVRAALMGVVMAIKTRRMETAAANAVENAISALKRKLGP
jgi:hypothetical protein